MPRAIKPVKVLTFTDHEDLEKFLNDLAFDPDNRYDLKFMTETTLNYTIVLYWTPE